MTRTPSTGRRPVKRIALTCGEPFIDPRDGQIYNTIKIGNQCWFAQNLNVGIRIDGNMEQGIDYNNIQKYCYNDDPANGEIYGGLYQWNQAMCGSVVPGAQGICPVGWHIPTDAEWKKLEMFLGMSQATADLEGYRGTNEGPKLAGNAGLWNAGILKNDPKFGKSKFDALPAGYRNTGGNFSDRAYSTYFWSSLKSGGNAWWRSLHCDHTDVRQGTGLKAYGFSVRCLKD